MPTVTYPPESFRLKEFGDNTEGASSSYNPHLFQSQPLRNDANGDDSVSELHHSTVGSNPPLVVNYLPTKFSIGRLPESLHARRHKGHNESTGSLMPMIASGAYGSREDAASEYGGDDEDWDSREESSTHAWLSNHRVGKYQKLRWNKFKWVLFTANVLLTVYSFIGLIFCLLAWFNTFQRADVLCAGNRPELVASTMASFLGFFTSLIGWAGILLNNRSFLAAYTSLLWVIFTFILIPGYITYKRRTFNLEGKINAQWSQKLGLLGRLRIQNELNCCGYFSPFVEATVSQTCYARSTLPGCKLAYLTFERATLKKWYLTAFAIVPVHIGVMIAGLLCSNHVTHRFGKGMMPKAYRLSMTSMAIIMESFANQLADQYGKTSGIINSRSRSKIRKRANSAFDSVSLIVGHGGSFDSDRTSLPHQ